MSVPKKRQSSGRSRRRRSHHRLDATARASCSQCKSPVLPHHVCMKCGMYRGKKVLTLANPFEKEKKKREKLDKAEVKASKEKPGAGTPEQHMKAR